MAKSNDNKTQAVSAENVPVLGNVEVATDQPEKAAAGETSGRVNPKLDTGYVAIPTGVDDEGVSQFDVYDAGQPYNLKNELYDLRDARGLAYFVKDND